MQHTLFAEAENITLPGGHLLTLYRHWMPEPEAISVHESLLASISWEQPSILIAGQRKTIPRLQRWFGERETAFEYSGTRFEPEPFTQLLISLKQRVESQCSLSFNSVLVNLYRNEQDSVGWHADDEPEFGERPQIASLSLGATRRFQLKPKAHFLEAAQWRLGQRVLSFELGSGDLLVMGAGVQENWLHSVPKERAGLDLRINLTFRDVVRGA